MPAFDTAKLHGQDLRDLVEAGEPEMRTSVIVEIKSTQTAAPHSYDAWREAPLSPDEIAQIDRADDATLTMDRVETQLKGLDLPKGPIRLDAAEAFVLSVTPSQLREISSWDLVGAIRPNRTYTAAPPTRSQGAAGPGSARTVARSAGIGRRHIPT